MVLGILIFNLKTKFELQYKHSYYFIRTYDFLNFFCKNESEIVKIPNIGGDLRHLFGAFLLIFFYHSFTHINHIHILIAASRETGLTCKSIIKLNEKYDD